MNQVISKINMFSGVNSSLIYCINDESELIIGTDITKYKKNCSDLCFKNTCKLTSTNIYEKECQKDSPYKNKNNECIKECSPIELFNDKCKINNNNPEV